MPELNPTGEAPLPEQAVLAEATAESPSPLLVAAFYRFAAMEQLPTLRQELLELATEHADWAVHDHALLLRGIASGRISTSEMV